MWSGLRTTAGAGEEVYSSVRELVESTSKVLIVITCGIYLAWYVAAVDYLPPRSAGGYFLVTLLVVFPGAISLRILSRWLAAAQILWLSGIVAAITLGVFVSQQTEVTYLYVLVPLIATVAIGWPAGAIAECLLIVLVGCLVRSGAAPLLGSRYPLVAAGGAFTCLLGWAMTRVLLTACQWALYSFEQARVKVEEARDQRVELKQTQDDLIRLNSELAGLADRLEAMRRQAEEARRAKELFVASVSHELRTPLNMIIGFSEMITDTPQLYGARLPSALLADISAIRNNGRHLAKLVDDVLDLSQVEAGRMALSKEWSFLQEIVEEATLAVRALFELKRLQLETAVSSDLPPVFCDSTRIRQVLLNLLSNAARVTETGGVRIDVRSDAGGVVVAVSDTGPGIAPEHQEGLFEPFRQLDLAARRSGGNGLGLSISKQFVEMHGGKMWLESEVGRGSTFFFSLPRDISTSAPSTHDGEMMRWFSPFHTYEARSRPSKAPAPHVRPRFILLEQGDALQRLMRRYMDDIEIAATTDVADVVRAARQSPAQAVIVNAPLGSQARAGTERLSGLPYGTPVITCWVPGPEEAAWRLGVEGYLQAPVSRKTLLSALSQLGNVRSVLLVDDGPEALQLLARMLSTEGNRYRIWQATSGRRALVLLRQHHPDAVVLDLVMPDMDGRQVLLEKSQDPSIRDIPVLVATSTDPNPHLMLGAGLTVTRDDGLSAQDLLRCMRALATILSPEAPPVRRARQEAADG